MDNHVMAFIVISVCASSPLNGGFCSFCASRAGNSFAYDPNPNSFDDSWALKHANFDLKTAGDHRKLQLNELNELRDQAYENSLIYKEMDCPDYEDSRAHGFVHRSLDLRSSASFWESNIQILSLMFLN
ncbi:hypothetical protein Tco_0629443 [Tanacetum coccineum]|uniref:Uncharacterized protein n=1 Tax=Tanacetum coccineum TaxID=301880 RepID=A0ABQ4WT44_9ASTR